MKKILFTFCICFVFFLSSCSANVTQSDCWIMDTYCSATLYGSVSVNSDNVIYETLKECEQSLFLRNDSKSFFADTDDCSVLIDNDIYEMLKICIDIFEISDGAFDITVAPLTKLWDIQNRTVPPTAEDVEKAEYYVSSKNLTLTETTLTINKKDCGIDFGAVGKGFAGDKSVKKLKELGYTSGILNLGGNVSVFGENPKRTDCSFVIGIRDPFDSSNIYVSVKVNDTNVVTAGGYERYFEYNGKIYHHIIDPDTGYPADKGIKSATVICKNGVVADAAATALYVLGANKSIETLQVLSEDYPDIAAILIEDNGNIIVYNIESYSPNFYGFEGEIVYYD